MNIHLRFFLSHDNSEKYQYFMKKVCILWKFRAKIALKRRALREVLMLLMTSLAKERDTAVKSVSYWKIYEMAVWKGKSCDKYHDVTLAANAAVYTLLAAPYKDYLNS